MQNVSQDSELASLCRNSNQLRKRLPMHGMRAMSPGSDIGCEDGDFAPGKKCPCLTPFYARSRIGVQLPSLGFLDPPKFRYKGSNNQLAVTLATCHEAHIGRSYAEFLCHKCIKPEV